MCNVIGCFQPGIGFDNHVQTRGVAAFGQELIQQDDFIRGANLGHHQRRWRGVGRKHVLHVSHLEPFADGIDAHDSLYAIVGLRCLEQFHRVGAGGGLVLWRNSVLQLNADNVCARSECLGLHRGVQPRRENKATARLWCVVGHVIFPRISI